MSIDGIRSCEWRIDSTRGMRGCLFDLSFVVDGPATVLSLCLLRSVDCC